jgi:hypothetical protein
MIVFCKGTDFRPLTVARSMMMQDTPSSKSAGAGMAGLETTKQLERLCNVTVSRKTRRSEVVRLVCRHCIVLG